MSKVRDKPLPGGARHVQRRLGFADDYRGAESALVPVGDLGTAAEGHLDRETADRFRAKPLISNRPHVEMTLGNALVTAHLELDLLRKRAMEAAAEGKGLSYEDQRWFTKLVETTSRLTREIRLQELHEAGETAALTDEELLERLEAAREALGEDT